MQRDQENWCDFLRVIAMIGVIFIHSSGPWLVLTPVGSLNWNVANIANAIGRPFVPIFFMLTGYLICRSQPASWGEFLSKRIRRLLPAFMFSTVFAVVLRMVEGERFSLSTLWEWTITPMFYHLWFLYAVALVYVALWLARPVSAQPIWGAILSYIFMLLVGGAIGTHIVGYEFRYEEFFSYYMFAIGGYYLALTPGRRSVAIACSVAGGALLVGVAILMYQASLRVRHVDQAWGGYGSVLVSTAAFLLFYAARHLLSRIRESRLIKRLSNYSLAIYCGHPFVIDILWHTVPNPFLIPSYIGIPALVLISLCVMVLISIAYERAISLTTRVSRSEGVATTPK